MRFYYPLKPIRITIDSSVFINCNNDNNFILQIKKNGWRIQIHKEGSDVKFFTRHNKRMEPIVQDADWEMLRQLVINNVKANCAIIDGEFLHRRGDLKNTIYIWDVFEVNKEPVDKPYSERKEFLESLIINHPNLYVAKDYSSGSFKQIWDQLYNIQEDEGIVIKDRREKLLINYKESKKSSKQFKILLEDKRNSL